MYLNPLFNTPSESHSPKQFVKQLQSILPRVIASAFDFDIQEVEPWDSEGVDLEWVDSGDPQFWELWNPSECLAPGFVLGGKYDSEDGPFAFGVKPNTRMARVALFLSKFMKPVQF